MVDQTGSFPEDGFSTGWKIPREYSVPIENVIAVRVFDEFAGGGIYAGPIGPVRPGYDGS